MKEILKLCPPVPGRTFALLPGTFNPNIYIKSKVRRTR